MKTILVPTDFSTNANNALKYANDFAKAINNKIILLHSYPPLVGKYNMIPGVVAEDIAIQKKRNYRRCSKKQISVNNNGNPRRKWFKENFIWQ